MFHNNKIAKFYLCSLGLLLYAIMTFFCFIITGRNLQLNKITKVNYPIIYTAHKNPQFAFISSTFISNLNSYYFLFEQVTDGQVYTPIKMEENKTSIKIDFSVASLAIVTAAWILA